jgi:ankyrin repeat protein
VVKVLASAGASLDQAMTTHGCTPLYIAAQNNHVEVVKVLLAAGVDLRHVNNNGYTALAAAEEGKKELKEDDEEGRRKSNEVITLLEQKIAATAAS